MLDALRDRPDFRLLMMDLAIPDRAVRAVILNGAGSRFPFLGSGIARNARTSGCPAARRAAPMILNQIGPSRL